MRLQPPSHSPPRSRHTDHQRPLHPYTGPTTSPTTPQHLSQRQHEQHLLSQQGTLFPYLPNGLLKVAQASRASTIPYTTFGTFSPALMAPPPHPSQTTPPIYSSPTPSASIKNILAHTPYSTMRTTNYSNSDCSALTSTSLAPSTHGNLPNFSNHFHILQPPTSTTISKPLFPLHYAPATNGASARTSTSHMVWFTLKRRSSGRKAAPLSLTSTHSAATSYASPAVLLTSSSYTSTHSTQANFPSRNSGTISTATSTKPQQTSHCTPPTTTWWDSSTRFPSIVLSTRSTP